jgi:hypothetical protein
MEREAALLNKIFRAVNDKVCPRCGGPMVYEEVDDSNEDDDLFLEGVHECQNCPFRVTDEEMRAMSEVVKEWGQEAVKEFEEWRAKRLAAKG